MADDHDEWLDVEAAGRLLSLPARTVRRLILNGAIEALRPTAMVRREALDAYLDRCRLKPGDLSFASRSKGRDGDPPLNKAVLPDRRFGPRYRSPPFAVSPQA